MMKRERSIGLLGVVDSLIPSDDNDNSFLLDDDFNSSEAISILFELANEINKTNSSELLILLKSLAQILGLLSKDPEHFLQGNNSKDDLDIELMIKKRNDAKKNKNFQEADDIRANLLEKGILLEDTPEGTIWRKK